MQSDSIKSIEQHPFFADWTLAEIAIIEKSTKRIHLDRDAIVFETGDCNFGCYLILDGEVSFFTPQGNSLSEIRHRCTGDIFGEWSLFTREPHLMRAKTCTPCELCFIPAEVIDHDLSKLSRPVRKLVGSLARHLGKTAIENAEASVRQEKLAAVGSMVNNIVHDFGTPFQMISLGAETIGKLSRDPHVQRLCSNITSQVVRLLQMSRALEEFSKGRNVINFQRMHLPELMAALHEDHPLFFESTGVDLTVAVPDVEIDVDPFRMLRLFQNLLSNSVEAMPGGIGKISITARELEGERIEIKVTDNGRGVPERIRGHLWEPFVTYGKRHGVGLGTSIVKNIVEEHGGTIDFTTETNKGTTFTMLLPQFHVAENA